MTSTEQPASTGENTIIDQFFLVGLRKSPPSDQPNPPKNRPLYQPYIKETWPDTPEARANQNRVPAFCFPEDIDQLVTAHLNNTSGQSIPNSSWYVIFVLRKHHFADSITISHISHYFSTIFI